jgi:hypothetical protein
VTTKSKLAQLYAPGGGYAISFVESDKTKTKTMEKL